MTKILTLILLLLSFSLMAQNYQEPLVKKIYRLYKKGDYVQTIKEIDLLISYIGDWGMAYYLKGRSYMQLQDYDNAAKSFKKASDLKVKPTSIFYEYAQILYSSNELEKARDFFKKSIEKDVQKVNGHYYVAYISQILEDYDEAIRNYQIVIDMDDADLSVKQSSTYQIAKIHLEQVESQKDQKKYIKDVVLKEMSNAYKVDDESAFSKEIKNEMYQVKKKYGFIYANGKPIKEYPYSIKLSQKIVYDSNVVLEADEAGNDQKTDKASPISKTELVGSYIYDYNKVWAIIPELRLSYDYHTSRKPDIYQNDNYIINPNLRNEIKHKINQMPASFLADLEYNSLSKDYLAEEKLQSYSTSFTFSFGEKISYFSFGDSTLKLKIKDYSGYTPALDSKTYTLSASQVYTTEKKDTVLFIFNADSTSAENETSSTGSYLFKGSFYRPKFYQDYDISAGLGITFLDTKLQSSTRGMETTLNPSVEFVKSINQVWDIWVNGKLALKYDFSKKLSKDKANYAYTKHVISLEFQIRL